MKQSLKHNSPNASRTKTSETMHTQPIDSRIKHLRTFSHHDQCSSHNQDFSLCCFDCSDMLACSKCMPFHKGHDVKNLHRGYILVETCLNEYIVCLGAKVDLFSLHHQKLTIARSQIVEDFGHIRKRIEHDFKLIMSELDRKNQQIIEMLENQRRDREDRLNDALVSLRSKIKLFMDSRKIIQNQIDKLGQASLCKFYSQKKQLIQQLIDETCDPNSLNGLMSRPQLQIQVERVAAIHRAIKDLKLNDREPENSRKRIGLARGSAVDLNSKELHQEVAQCFKKPKMQRQSHPNIFSTPKNESATQQNTIRNIEGEWGEGRVPKTAVKVGRVSRDPHLLELKHLRSHPMLSMPSSPHKDKKQSQTPLHYLELQKKNFNLAKHEV